MATTHVLNKIQEATEQNLLAMLNSLAAKPMTAMSENNTKKIAIRSVK
jgi:hypothetical protein